MSDADRRAAAANKAAAPESLRGLYLAVAARCAAVAAEFWHLSNKAGEEQAPQVIPGWMPPNYPEAARFPFLLVRPQRGRDDVPGAAPTSTATVEIVVGTYSDTDDGWIDALALVDALRLDLAAKPTEGAYEHTGPLTWELPDEQPRPQWLARVTTSWTLPRPRRVEARNPPTTIEE